MFPFFFWKNWKYAHKLLYTILLACFLLILAGYLFAYYYGAHAVLDWEVITSLEKLNVTADQFNTGLFNFSYQVENQLVQQKIQGTPVNVNFSAAYIYLGILALGMVIGLSIITFFKRVWYFLGVGVFIGLLISFKLEHLQLFGLVNKIPVVIAFLIFLPASYFFHSLRPHFSLWFRIGVFAFLTLLFALLVGNFSGEKYPFLFIAHYGLVGPLLLTIFVIFLVAHEIIYLFLKIITSGNAAQSKNSVAHFTVLTGFYLFNVLLTYLNNTGIVSWNIIYINAFILFACSLLVGIYGFRDSEELYGEIIPFKPFGGLLYLVLGMVSMGVIIFCMANGNDPMVEVFEDAIIYSHFAFGLTFFIYVMYNFFSLLMENQEVYKVVYRPRNLPYYFTKIAGFIIISIFVFRADMFPFYQGIAGYYNGVGDVYMAQDEHFAAEQYYKLANQHEYQNHRSNYSLATLAKQQGDGGTAVYYYKQSLNKKPTPYAYINLANIHSSNSNYFDALFALREGLKEFPGNGRIQNNIGLLFSQTSVIDSAFYFLNAARKNEATKNVGETNLIGLIAKNNLATEQMGIIEDPDEELPELFRQRDYLPAKINAQALINQQSRDTLRQFQKLLPPPEPEQYLSGQLDKVEFAWLFNGVFNQRYNADTLISNHLDSIGRLSGNPGFQRSLGFLANINLYEQARVRDAFEGMEELLIADKGQSGYYNHILGNWALQQKAPLLAAEYFARAANFNYQGAQFNRAIALSEAARRYPLEKPNALQAWREILATDTVGENRARSRAARDMIRIWQGVDYDSLITADDPMKYMAIRYKGWDISENHLRQLMNSFDNSVYRGRAIIDLFRMILHNHHDRAALKRVATLRQLIPAEASLNLGKQWPWVEAGLLMRQEEMGQLKNKLTALNPENSFQKTQKNHFQAMIAWEGGDRDSAKKYFDKVTGNPFYEQGNLDASRFYRDAIGKKMQAYNTLLNAIRVNKYGVSLLKNYILLSLDMGMDNYAASALDDLKMLLSADEFEAFKTTYDQKRTALSNEEW